jgi:hypothetical protein
MPIGMDENGGGSAIGLLRSVSAWSLAGVDDAAG